MSEILILLPNRYVKIPQNPLHEQEFRMHLHLGQMEQFKVKGPGNHIKRSTRESRPVVGYQHGITEYLG